MSEKTAAGDPTGALTRARSCAAAARRNLADGNVESAISRLHEALRLLPPGAGDVERASILQTTGNAYRRRSSGDRADNLDQAIGCFTAAEELLHNDPGRSTLARAALGSAYFARAEEPPRGQAALPVADEDVERAIVWLARAVEAPELRQFPDTFGEALRELGQAYAQRTRGDRAENEDRAISCLQQSLDILPPAESFLAAAVLKTIADLHLRRLRGKRHDNVEAALRALSRAQALLDVAPQPQAADLYARLVCQVHYCLGNAFAERLAGDRAANVEAAIDHHTAAVQGSSPLSDLSGWANAMSMLAHDYRTRPTGDAESNLERARALLENVLYTLQDRLPKVAAVALNRLGSVYRARLVGDRADNLERSIACYRRALSLLSPDDSPVVWGQVQNNLGNAYAERLAGDPTDNLLHAIGCFESALEVVNPQEQPGLRAGLLLNLGATYEQLPGGDEADLRRAEECYEEALSVVTRDTEPFVWAGVRERLAAAQLYRIPDSPAAAQRAVDGFRDILTVYSPDSTPADWARVQYQLGRVYLFPAARDLRQAVACLEQALTVRTKQALPIDWAKTRYVLGMAYRLSGVDQDTTDLRRAAAAFQDAAGKFREAGLTQWWAGAAQQLGEVQEALGDVGAAAAAYQEAVAASDSLYSAAILLPSREAELTRVGELHTAAAIAAAAQGEAMTAALLLERGRTRLLGDVLGRDRADLTKLQEEDPDLFARFQHAADTLRQLEGRQNASMFEPARLSGPRQYGNLIERRVLRQQSAEWREQLRAAVHELDAAAAAIREVTGQTEFLRPANQDLLVHASTEAPLAFLATGERQGVAVLVYGTQTTVIELPHLTSNDLATRSNRFLAAVSYRHDDVAWSAEIDDLTAWLWDVAVGALCDHVTGKPALVIVPVGLFSLLPLHAAWTPDAAAATGRSYLIDLLPVTYAPSARTLTHCRDWADVPTLSLLTVADPQPVAAPALSLAAREASVSCARFSECHQLTAEQATAAAVRAALPQAAVAHFACHGQADANRPRQSGLLLARNELLTVDQLHALRLRLRLAVLSACGTAVPGLPLPDEMIGLPGAFVQAGTAGAVATLWSVPDDIALLLMVGFFARWPPGPAAPAWSPAQALRMAQRELRDSRNDELRQRFEAMMDDPEQAAVASAVEACWDRVALLDPDSRSFASPGGWGAFGCYGT